MNENVAIANLISVITAGFAARAVTVGIKQSYQPVQQGAPSLPTIFLHKISDNEYGFPQRKDVWNATSGAMNHTENQWIETTYQVNATTTQDPSNTTQLTAGDYVKTTARILGSDVAVVALTALGIGIMRIQKITNTFFTNERSQHEASPSFDFTISYVFSEMTVEPSATTLVGTVIEIL
jgi:hypothetical protein